MDGLVGVVIIWVIVGGGSRLTLVDLGTCECKRGQPKEERCQCESGASRKIDNDSLPVDCSTEEVRNATALCQILHRTTDNEPFGNGARHCSAGGVQRRRIQGQLG